MNKGNDAGAAPPRPDLAHWGRSEQLGAVDNIRGFKNPLIAVTILRSELPMIQELRDAIADLIEGKIKLRRTSKNEGKPYTEDMRFVHRARVKLLRKQGMSREEALRTIVGEEGKDPYDPRAMSSLDNFLRAKHRKK